MKSLPLLALLGLSILLSCSTKSQEETMYLDLSSHLDQKNQKNQINNGYTKGLDKIKPSKNSNVKAEDFQTYATAENFEMLLKEDRASFVVFGMVWFDYSDFEKKYGIKVKTENCVITPGISKIAKINNQLIADYLNRKYDTAWKSDLKIIPFGIE